MTKEKIKLADLQALFLKELTAEPNCGGVSEIKVVAGHRLGSSERWKVVDWKGEGDDEGVEAGLKAVYAKLDGKYDIEA